tara:strand:+ start:92 stop:382 length:291 start_codon:yes stop_codon:yes gene_type:complete
MIICIVLLSCLIFAYMIKSSTQESLRKASSISSFPTTLDQFNVFFKEKGLDPEVAIMAILDDPYNYEDLHSLEDIPGYEDLYEALLASGVFSVRSN